MKYCSSASPGAEDAVEPKPFAQPFEYTPEFQDGPGTTWNVTLTKVECGLRAIKDADSNPDWQGGDEVPQYIAAKPDPGNDFCILHWSWSNVGKKPGSTDQAGDVVLGDERFMASSEDQSRAWTIMDTHLDISYAAPINPRKSTKSLDVYQVPEGESITAVWFPAETDAQASGVLVAAA